MAELPNGSNHGPLFGGALPSGLTARLVRLGGWLAANMNGQRRQREGVPSLGIVARGQPRPQPMSMIEAGCLQDSSYRLPRPCPL